MSNPMQAIKRAIIVLCALTAGYATRSNAAIPVITSQPQSAIVVPGTNVNFAVVVQAGTLPTVSSGTLKLWLKADAGVVLQTNRVSQWQDQSGGNRHASQSNTNKQPVVVSGAVNGQPVLRFDGIQNSSTGDYLQGTSDLGLTAGFTSFLVYSKIDRGSGIEDMLALVGTPGINHSVRGFYCLGNEMAFSTWGFDYFSGFTIPGSTYRIWTERLNAAKTQIDLFDTNGTNDFGVSLATSGLTTPSSGYYVGGLGSSARNVQGDIAELIYYQGTLSESDRQLVASYLKLKYFTPGGTNTSAISYQWQFNNTNILTATNATFSLTNVQPADAGTYSVIITNSDGAVTSSNALLTVISPVTITSHPESKTVIAGTNVLFSVSAQGGGELIYKWKLNGSILIGQTNATLTINNVQATNAGTYSVTVSNAVSVVTSSNAVLSVLTPPVILNQPTGASVVPGTNVTFTVGVQGSLAAVSSGSLKLWLRADAGVVSLNNRVSQWQDQSGRNNDCFQANTNKQPLLVSGAVNGQPVLRFDGIQDTITGDYLQGTNDLGLTAGFTSFLVYLKVRTGSLEEIPAAAGAPEIDWALRSFYCAGPQMGFACWQNDYLSGFTIPSSTYRIWTERLNSSKTQIEFFDTNGTNDFTTARTTVNLIDPASGYYVGGLGASTRNFQGDVAELIYYQGNLSETDRQLVATYLKQKYYSASITNVQDVSYQWQFNGIDILNATNASITLTNVQFTNAGNYSVILSNSVGTVTSSNALLTVVTPVSITSHPQGQAVVAGSNAVFNVSAQGDGTLYYQWKLNGIAITGETTSALTLTNVQATNVGSYSVTILNAVSTVTSSNAILSILYPPSIISQPQSASILAGTNVTFSVGAQGTGTLPALSSGTLKLWLKADAGVILQSNRVSQWQDQSGGNRHAFQADTNKQPLLVNGAINGQSSVRFDGVVSASLGDYLQGTNDLGLTAGFTSFMVYSKINRVTPVDEALVVVGEPAYNSIRASYFSGNEMAFSAWSNDYFSGFTVPGSTYRIWTQRLNSSKTQLDFFDTNGTNDFTVSRTTSGLLSPSSGYYVGGLGPSTRNFQGYVAEVISYQGSLSESDRQLVATYLKEKYYGFGTIQGISYQWQFNGTNLVGATNTFLTLTNAQSADAGSYSVILSNSIGTVNSSNAVLTVTVPVAITSHPQGQAVAAGTNVVFNVSAQGDGPLFYQWKLNGIAIIGEITSALTITNVQAANVGSYSVTISNAVSAVTSSNAILSIVSPPLIISQPQDTSAIAGSNVTFTVTVKEVFPEVSSGNLKLWLKADAGVVLQSNRVSQWQDQSGGNRHSFQADTNKQPSLVSGVLNGQPVLRFDGVQNTSIGDFLQGTNDLGLTAGFTSFMVYTKRNRGTPVEEVPALVGTPGEYHSVRGYYCLGNEMAFSAWGNDYYSGFTIPGSTYRIWTERLNSNKTQLDFFDTDGTNNFTASRTTAGLLSPGSGYYVGGLGSNTRNFQGDIAELIYYQGNLSEADRQAVANYLKQKYFASGGLGQEVGYQWQFNGTNILGATNAFFTLTNVQPANAGTYSVVVSNSVGTVTSSNALLTVNIPPSISAQPQAQSINAGLTATFNVVASGTGTLSYQWQKGLSDLSGATNSSLVLTDLQPSDAASYRVIVSSPYGSVTSTNAALTVNVSTVRAVDMNVSSATTVTLPIDLVALGNENALGFSLLFDSTIFSYAGATVGSGFSQATLIANTNQLGSGKLGLAIALSANSTFPAGTQQVIQVSFNVAPVTNAQTSLITVGDIPTGRQVSDATAHALWSAFFGATITIAPSDFEGDVSPRPTGDRSLTITDWVQVGRFAAGLDTIANGSEFQRVDCAPRSSGGNGSISVTDWVQAGRYATGADPLTPAAGPTGAFSFATKSKPIPSNFGPDRVIQIQSNAQQGQNYVVSVDLVAVGDESALGFSLSYNPATLTFVSSEIGSSASGAVLNVNTNNASSGKLGFTLALSFGHTFAVGTQEVVKLTFAAAPFTNGITTLTFADSPVLREVSDAKANSLSATYSNGSLLLVQSGPLLKITNAVTGIVVSWPASATNFALETSSSWTNWSGVTNNLNTNGDVITTTLPLSDEQKFYRLKK